MLPDSKNDLKFHGPINRWDEGIPLGNGRCGCLIWGDSQALRLSIDRSDLWETTPCEMTKSPDFTYASMRRMVKNRQWEDLNRTFDEPYSCPYPTKLAAGRIVLGFGEKAPMESVLSLGDALAVINLSLSDGPIVLRLFLHAEKQAGLLHLSRMPKNFTWRAEYPAYNFGDEKKLLDRGRFEGDNSLELFTYPRPEIIAENNTKGFYFTISGTQHYGLLMRRFHTRDGELFVWDTETAENLQTLRDILPKRLSAIAGEGFEALFASHRDWWHRYWNKSGIRISEELFEKNWYLTQYLFASCSREGSLPMPLQGVWTADDGMLPPWKGDYHNDLNTEMSYYLYLKANHLEEGKSFLDFLWNLVPAARDFAKSFYNAEGICLPSVMTAEGQPVCGWAMYSFSPGCQIWLSHLFERYYRYTGDLDFLRERAYPYMKETARFIQCLLEEGEDGLLYLPLSSSPEIHDNLPEAWIRPNSNFDLALMRFLFSQLEELSSLAAPEDREGWSETLRRLPQLAINEHKCYRISSTEDLPESHRHFSHLMALYPLRLTEYDTEENRAVIDACVDQLELLGTGLWVGYSFGWMAQLYALQGNGEGAAAQLELFWRYFCSPNGFHLNGDYKNGGFCTWHYRPFTLEGNMLAADALQEMLLYSEKDKIRIFPAVPDRFGDEEFSGFRAQNGILVSARRRDGVITDVKLHGDRPCSVILKNGASLNPELSGLPYRTEPVGENDLKITFGKGRTDL